MILNYLNHCTSLKVSNKLNGGGSVESEQKEFVQPNPWNKFPQSTLMLIVVFIRTSVKMLLEAYSRRTGCERLNPEKISSTQTK